MILCPLCYASQCVFDRRVNRIDLLKCTSCGFVFANVSKERIQEVNEGFDEEAERVYEECQTILDKLWFRSIAERFTKKIGVGKVVDVGCGNGALLREFIAMGWECWGVDPSPWSRKFADRYGFKLFQGDLGSADSGMSEFDLVVSSSTLEHIADPVHHVGAILKRLRAGGYAYFCGIPNYASASVRLGFSKFYMNNPPGHVNYFTPQTMRSLFEKVGPLTGAVHVRTYGIPEVHFFYNRLVQYLFAKRHRPSRAGESPVRPERVPVLRENPIKTTLFRLLLATFYHLGKLGSGGDKLEVLVQR
jgi:SAM-dependent methyltransferase